MRVSADRPEDDDIRCFVCRRILCRHREQSRTREGQRERILAILTRMLMERLTTPPSEKEVWHDE